MSNKEHRPDDVPQEGPEHENSGPLPHEGQPEEQAEDDTLTVDDILGAEQTGDAAGADDAADADSVEATDDSNPYLEDLRRLSAEYANYRKRTEANAKLEKQRALANAIAPLLPVLDDIDRAEQHGDLVEGSAFTTIAQKLRGTLERQGLVGFGEVGEVFDPSVHEAIAQVPTPGAEGETVLDVVERGYRVGEVELRPAKVAVAVGADG